MNNPFSKNRFQCLEEESSSSNYYTNKKEKKKESYDSNKNSFIKEREKTNFSNPRRYNNDNKNSEYIKKKEKEDKKMFIIEEVEFPEITTSMSISNNSKINFRDAIKKEIEIEIENIDFVENKVKPGCVEISHINGKIVFKEGPLTPYLIHIQKREEYEKTPHYIMNKAISSILQNREKYIDEYNSIHGENAYEELYVLPPVYGPEYELEEEESDDCLETDEND